MRALRVSNTLSRILLSSSSSATAGGPCSSRFLTNFLSSPHRYDSAAVTGTGNVVVDAFPWWSAIQRRGIVVSANELRIGNVIEKRDKTYEVVAVKHSQKGRGGASISVDLRNVDDGKQHNERFNPEDSVERVFVQERDLTCLYTEHDVVYLMDPEKFEQLEVPIHLFGDKVKYLKEEMTVKLKMYDERPMSATVPKQVKCVIKEAPAAVKGQSVTPRYVQLYAGCSFVGALLNYKKALLDNDLAIDVPGYLDAGEEIIINTEDHTFVKRARE